MHPSTRIYTASVMTDGRTDVQREREEEWGFFCVFLRLSSVVRARVCVWVLRYSSFQRGKEGSRRFSRALLCGEQRGGGERKATGIKQCAKNTLANLRLFCGVGVGDCILEVFLSQERSMRHNGQWERRAWHVVFQRMKLS